MNILECQKELSGELYEKISTEFDETYPKICFESVRNKFNTLDIVNNEIEVNHWISQFNNSIFNISLNYIQMAIYYNAKGNTDDNICTHFWYAYYAESLTQRVVSAYDLLFHLINARYKFGHTPKIGFRRSVLNSLREENEEFYNKLNNKMTDEKYIKLSELRNDFAHNNNPTDLTSGITREKQITYFSQGERKSDSELLEEIRGGIEHLEQTKECLEKYLDEYPREYELAK